MNFSETLKPSLNNTYIFIEREEGCELKIGRIFPRVYNKNSGVWEILDDQEATE